MKLPEHLFLSSDGALFDTRKPAWSANPIRPDYSRTYARIRTSTQLRATLRAGPYAWPGGYPLYFIADDGESLSFEAVREQYYQCAYSIRHDIRDGWRIVGCGINYEDDDVVCAHTGKRIPSAYGDTE